MASTLIEESVRLTVEEVEKRGKEGRYKEKAVKYSGKTYTVSKNDRDSVKVGKAYNFSLSKSEYNDKLYYWANLVKDESSEKGGEGSSSEGMDSKLFFDYWNGLTAERQMKALKYFINNNKIFEN